MLFLLAVACGSGLDGKKILADWAPTRKESGWGNRSGDNKNDSCDGRMTVSPAD